MSPGATHGRPGVPGSITSAAFATVAEHHTRRPTADVVQDRSTDARRQRRGVIRADAPACQCLSLACFATYEAKMRMAFEGIPLIKGMDKEDGQTLKQPTGTDPGKLCESRQIDVRQADEEEHRPTEPSPHRVPSH